MSQKLCLDLGTKTGWALISGRKVLASGTATFAPQRFEGGGMRFVRFRRFLTEFGPIDEIYFEEVRRHLGVDAAHVYGGLMAILTAYGDENKVPYLGIPVGTIKRHVTGKGTASKDEVIEWAKSKGFRPGDDNEADALAIADLVMNGDPTARASVTKKRKVKSK